MLEMVCLVRDAKLREGLPCQFRRQINYPHKALSNNDPDAFPQFKIDVVEFWSLTIQKKLPTTRENTRCCKAYHTLINSAWIGCGSQRHAVT